MPNHVINWLCADKNILDSLKGESDCDFNAVIPMPKALSMECSIGIEAAAKRALLDLPTTNALGGMLARLEISNMMDTKITPPPLEFNKTDWTYFIRMLYNKRVHGHYTWYSWRTERWGTKWNAYGIERRGDCLLVFQTAWSYPEPVIVELSKRYPDADIRLKFADEDYGNNLGEILVRNGVISDRYPETFDRNEFAYDLWELSESDRAELECDERKQ